MPGKFFTLTSFVAASVLAILAAPPTAEAQNQGRMRFAAMDTNNDGRITRDEWRGADRSFEVHDWNGDGVLSGDEVRPGAQRNSQLEPADHSPGRYERNITWTTTGFNNLDHNRDRRITPNEWHFDRETFRRVDSNRDGAIDQREFLGADVDDDRGDNFDDLDYNNNGWVERSEWHGSDAVFDRLDRNNDSRLSRFEVAGGSDTNFDTYDEFASVDVNRNGTLSRDEWHWSLGSFNQRDLNRDGVLSRREFEATGGADASPVGTSGAARTIRVNSQQRWTDAGITVRAGERLNIDASGTVTLSDNGGDTATPAGATSGRRAPDAPVLNQPAGGLIARIDDYGPIFIGSRGTFTAPVSGRLYFGVNDDHLPDNRGEFTVTLSR